MANLSPAETARHFALSIKALRLYESRGLLKPLRTEAGWRVYGPDQIARLHQIIALKRLGLSLAKIGEILGRADALGPVLALQEEVLEREGARLTRALALVRAARAKLGSGQALSIDDLANLTKETVMPAMPAHDKKALFEEIFARHFTQEERETIRRNRAAAMEEWLALKPQLLAAMATGDPASPAARAVVRRCADLSRRMTGDDGDLRARFQAFRDAVSGDPEIAGLMAVTPEMNDFIKQAASK